MPEVIEAPHEIITRKGHICFGCEEIYPKGTKMEVHVNKEDGEIYRLYLCKHCLEHWDEPWLDAMYYVDEGLSQGELKTFCNEYKGRTCEECKSRG